MSAAWSAVVVALIGGPVMWALYRLDKRNTQQHGQSIQIIQEVQENVKDIKADMRDIKGDVRDLKLDVRILQTPAKLPRIKKVS